MSYVALTADALRAHDLNFQQQNQQMSEQQKKREISFKQTSIMTKSNSKQLIRDLLSRYYIEQEWNINWPDVLHPSYLLYIPESFSGALNFPSDGPCTSDLDFTKIGLLESIKLEYFLNNPVLKKKMELSSKQLEEEEEKIYEKNLHLPIRTAIEKNKNLDPQDFALINVDFASESHELRNLPSLAYLNKPIYTEMGEFDPSQRKENRLLQIAKKYDTSEDKKDILEKSEKNSKYISQAEEWRDKCKKTFRNANHIDAEFNKMVNDIALQKLGLIVEDCENLKKEKKTKVVKDLLKLFAFISSNGIALGQNKNFDNGSKVLNLGSPTESKFYLTAFNGAIVSSTIWKNICLLAQTKWNIKSNDQQQPQFNAGAWVSETLFEAGIVQNENNLFNGQEEVKMKVFETLLSWINEYYSLLFDEENKKHENENNPLVHTVIDLNPVSYDRNSINKNKSLLMATNIALPKLFLDFSRNSCSSALKDNSLLINKEEEAGSNISTLKKPNGAVPLAIYPVFPDNFSILESSGDYSSSTINYCLGNSEDFASLQLITLNSEKNTFADSNINISEINSASNCNINSNVGYVPATNRPPQVLLGDQFYLTPASNFVLDAKKDFTSSYILGNEAQYEKYLSEIGNSTLNYVLNIITDHDERDSHVIYSRVPSRSRYRRAMRQKNAKCNITINYQGDDKFAESSQKRLCNLENIYESNESFFSNINNEASANDVMAIDNPNEMLVLENIESRKRPREDSENKKVDDGII